LALISACAAALVACSQGTPDYIEGFAATGAAMAGASVKVRCVSGAEVTGTTDANGRFSLSIDNGQVAPCIVQVSGGGTTLHSFAAGAGRLNVTPLTELSVGKALGADPSTAFAGFDTTKASTISGGLTAAKAAIKTQVEALTGKSIAGDMFTSTFKVGDADDLVLDALKAELAAVNKPLSTLVAAVAQGKPVAPRVKVFGDSLSDSGTFGLKFTVQGTAATGAGSADIWVDLVAKPLQTARLCPYYTSTGASFTTRSECTNFAIGGGRVNSNSPSLAGSADPRSVPVQLQAAAQVYGSYAAADVLLVVGGGNDAADLAGAWLGATTPAGAQAFQGLLAGVLGAGATAQILGDGTNPNAPVVAGMAYMEALAGKLADAIQEHAVGKGAEKVLVMNVPDIALTPRFSAVLAGVAAQTSPAQAAQAAQVKQVIQTWVNSFNSALASRFTNSTKVAVLDFNTVFRAQVAAPASYGFTDGTNTACPAVGTDSSGLPTYNFPACTAAALSATANKPSVDWWKTYMFSDGFHPTPLAHAKAADEALKVFTQRGWN
jgi:phospholipase/lecithinase/hemolysin